MSTPKKMLLATCPHCGIFYTYDYIKMTGYMDDPPMYLRYGCQCGEEFDLVLLSGVTHKIEYPGRLKTYLTAMDTFMHPIAKLDHRISMRWGHPLGKWLQEWLHVSKYHLTLYSMTAGIVFAAVDHLPVSLFSALIWVFICLPTLVWSYQKVQSGAGEDGGSGDAASLSVKDMQAMRASRSGRRAPLFAFLVGIPLLVSGPDLFTIGMFLVYAGMVFATIPYVPPSKRKVWFPEPKPASVLT